MFDSLKINIIFKLFLSLNFKFPLKNKDTKIAPGIKPKTTPKIKAWLSAFRLRTLPLAFSSIITGSAIAYYHYAFKLDIFILALLTTLFLQILSNLANDYGDSATGVDNNERVGPMRAIQSGEISKAAMKKAMVLFSILSLCSGIPLIIEGTKQINLKWFLFFLTLGIGSIAAAIKYTAGKNPYGYKGLGDIFVFLFFGLVGVLGCFILQFQIINREVLLEALLPAVSIGCFSAAVLNLNNMRDAENDEKCGKITLAVRLGKTKSKIYHSWILIVGMATLFKFSETIYLPTIAQVLLLLPCSILIFNIFKVIFNTNPKDLDPELKKVALSTFATSITLFCLIANYL